MERQTAIYVNGFAGKRSKIPVDTTKLEQKAITQMSKKAAGYIAGGAGSQSSVTNNRTSFEKYHIVPRMLRNVSIRDTSIELFGKKFSSPLILSPVGVLEMVHKQADIAVGKAAALENVPYIFSNQIAGSLLMVKMAERNYTKPVGRF